MYNGDQCVCQVYMLWNIREQSGVCHACEREYYINFPGTRLRWPTCPIYHIWPLRSVLSSKVSWCARNRRRKEKTKLWGKKFLTLTNYNSKESDFILLWLFHQTKARWSGSARRLNSSKIRAAKESRGWARCNVSYLFENKICGWCWTYMSLL